MNANANGNITTGCINMGSTDPKNAKNYNFTDISDSNKHFKFSGKPDAAECYGKFTPGTKVGSPNGRINFLIHGAGNYRDPELDADANKKFASASIYITPCTDWTKFTAEFEYNDNYIGYTEQKEDEQRYMLASITTNPTPGGSYDDDLQVDDIKLIYRSQLTTLSCNGEAVAGFSKDTYSYNVADYYAEGCLTYTANGRSATTSESYDEKTGVATITVSNVDADEDGQKQHVYTVKFKRKLTISDETTYDGTAEGMFDAVVLDRDFVKGWNTVCLPFDVTASDLCTGATAQEFASYNAESGLNFTIVNGTMQAGKPYLVFFPQAVSSDLMFENKAVTTGQPTSVSHDGVTFTGNYTAEMPMTGLYGVVLCEDGRGRIMRGGSETTLRPTRAYFTLPADLQTASLNINLQQIGDGTTTGIGATQTAGGDEAAYDLTGRRVQKTTQGLYIVGGRKVIVK